MYSTVLIKPNQWYETANIEIMKKNIISASLYERIKANGIELLLVPSVGPHMWAVATRVNESLSNSLS